MAAIIHSLCLISVPGSHLVWPIRGQFIVHVLTNIEEMIHFVVSVCHRYRRLTPMLNHTAHTSIRYAQIHNNNTVPH